MDNIFSPDFESKDKIFTTVITKIVVEVILQTTTNRIHGKVHVRQGDRLKDELENSGTVIAITDAEIYDVNGTTLIYKTSFVAVQVTQLVWIFPVEEMKKTE